MVRLRAYIRYIRQRTRLAESMLLDISSNEYFFYKDMQRDIERYVAKDPSTRDYWLSKKSHGETIYHTPGLTCAQMKYKINKQQEALLAYIKCIESKYEKKYNM